MKKGILVLVIIALVIVAGYFYYDSTKSEVPGKVADLKSDVEEEVEPEEASAPTSNINIYKGTDRPMAFMIDNNVNAQPQASLNSAYLIYEIIVEGGETRLMALFKGVTCDTVGPIRSARHYFLDYVMENDAIYAHLGLSPQADTQMKQFGINNINGQVYDTGKARNASSLYWRATHKKAPHNAYTNTDSIKKIASGLGYRVTSNKESVLNYVTDEVTLDSKESVMVANTITIPYTTSHKVEYKYDSASGRYTRYSKGKLIKDETTGEAATTKNLIITFAENYTLDDGENKGRQDVLTVGSLDGYYITNGKAIKIKCNKSSRDSQTEYVDLNGNEIEVNDGNTWINIVPIDSNVSISE